MKAKVGTDGSPRRALIGQTLAKNKRKRALWRLPRSCEWQEAAIELSSAKFDRLGAPRTGDLLDQSICAGALRDETVSISAYGVLIYSI